MAFDPTKHAIKHFLWPGWLDRQEDLALKSQMEKAGLGLVHIPKTGGNAISEVLYEYGPSHRTWRWYQGMSCPLIAVVRDPIDRFLSAYDYLKSGGNSVNDRLFSLFYLSKDINTFARQLEASARRRSYYHFQEQSHYTLNGNTVMIDELVPYEKLSERFPNLPVVNKTSGKRTPVGTLTPQSMEIIKGIYRRDFYIHRLALQDGRNAKGRRIP